MPEAEPDHLRPARRRRRPRLYPALLAALLWGNAHAAQTITTQTITVRTGDTLWALAGRYGTTVQAIRAANGLKDDRIQAGQTLRLGAPAASSASKTTSQAAKRGGSVAGMPTQPYTVKKGDTLQAIAARARVDATDIRRANGLRGDALSAGQPLQIPAWPLPPEGQRVQVVYGYITVQTGQSLQSLARDYHTTAGDLLAANHLRTGAVYTGQRLRVPKRVPVPVPPAPVAPPVSLHTRRPLGIPVQIVRVDLRHRDVLVSPVFPAGGRRSARVSTLVCQSGADALINGSYFHPQTYAPAGDVVQGGQLLSWSHIPAALAITPDNRAVITGGTGGAGAQAWRGMETVIASGPRILVGGQLRLGSEAAFRDPAVYGRAARSAVGLSGERDLWLVSTQARLTPAEMARVMQQLGAQNALLLDGGSSAGLAWSNRAVMDSLRSVAFGVGVFAHYPGRRYMR